MRLKKYLEFELYCVDHPMVREEIPKKFRISENFLRLPKQLEEELKTVSFEELKEGIQEMFDISYFKLSLFLEAEKSLGGVIKPYLNGREDERESYMAQKIIETKPEVHICGLIHMIENLSGDLAKMFSKKTLAKRLKESGMEIKTIELVIADYIRSLNTNPYSP